MVAYKERAPGIYRAKFVKLDTNYKITDRETQEEVTRWRWVFQEEGDPTTVGEIDTVSTPGFKSRSNGLKFLTGMLGRAPTENDDTDNLLGLSFNVVFGPNQNGRNTIVGVSRLTDPLPETAPENADIVAAAAALPATPPGELP